MKRIALILAAALAAALGIVSLPNSAPTAAADVYTEPGHHIVNGREWYTTCEPYSSSVVRCRAEIKATSIKLVNGVFVETTDYVFNNLTYKPSQRSTWKGNPLGETGQWTSADGRKWRTECDTATTGRNGCRSYIWTTVYAVKTMTPRTYEQRNEWVFNNIVQFHPPVTVPTPTPPPGACNNATLPAGFALTADGRPYVPKAPYKPADQYNPTSIGNFVKSVISTYNAMSPNDPKRADQKCLALLGADHLLKGSETTTRVDGDGVEHTVRWFPYMFRFSANPEINDLLPPWHSGLAQGGVLSAFIQLDALTGDPKWLEYGDEAFQSFLVPIDEPEGFVSRENGFLWFEEYPTTPDPNGAYGPGTTVLNGHLEAIIGLDLWAAKTGNPEAKALVTEALDDLEPLLEQTELDTDGGIGTTYDLVRGHGASPLRLVGSGNAAPNATLIQLNGEDIAIPQLKRPADAKGSLLVNSGFDEVEDGFPTGWSRLGSAQFSSLQGEDYRTVSGGNAWQGLQQVVPARKFIANAPMAITLDAKVTLPAGRAGSSGRVAVYSQCSGKTTLLYENVIRGSGWKTYHLSFDAPAAGCDILFQFMLSPYDRAGTEVLWDDVELRQADPLVPNAYIKPSYDMMVHRTPEYSVTLKGSGTATLQAYSENRWQSIQTVNLTSTPQSITVPERFTGRNIHMGYHETHVSELMMLYKRTVPSGGKPHPYPFLLEYAQRWAPLAPSTGYLVPQRDLLVEPPTGTELLQRGDSTISDEEFAYEHGLVDMFTGLPYDELDYLDELAQPAS